MRAFLNKKMLFAGIGSLVLGVALTAGVFAAIPDSNTGRITACRNNNTGTLKAIDAQNGATCGNFETMLSWYSTSAPSIGAGPKSAIFHLSTNSDTSDTDFPVVYNPALSRDVVAVKKLVANDPVNNPMDARSYCIDLDFVVLHHNNSLPGNPEPLYPAILEGNISIDQACGLGYDVLVSPGNEVHSIFFTE